MLMYTTYFLEENTAQEHGLGNIAVEKVYAVRLLEQGNGHTF